MSDLPAQGLYQQMHARPISGEQLEVFGKAASAKWRTGECDDLNDAVVTIVKHAGLSPEQVKRVVEFANTDAFLHEFKKEGAEFKVVDFPGGPADPSEILKDLNDGGGGSVFDSGMLDYTSQPSSTKVSSVHEGALREWFGQESDLPYAEPLQEAMDLRDKLASVHDTMTSELSGLEGMYSDLSEDLYQTVKQAALGGHSLGNIAGVMAVGAPDPEYMKVAFKFLTPRLLKEEVFSNLDAAVASMDKTAAYRTPNGEHSLVTQTREFSECLLKLAEIRAAREEIHAVYDEVTGYIKEAADGVLPKAYDKVTSVAKNVGKHSGEAARKVTKKLVGGNGERVGKVVEKVVSHAPHAAGAAATLMLARRLRNSPTVRSARYKLRSEFEPWTDEYKYETARQRGEV